MLKCLISYFQLLYLHPANSLYFNLNELLNVQHIFQTTVHERKNNVPWAQRYVILQKKQRRHILSSTLFQFVSYKTLNGNITLQQFLCICTDKQTSSVIFPTSVCLYCKQNMASPTKVSQDVLKQGSLSCIWTKQDRYYLQELIHLVLLLFGVQVQITCA